MNYKSPSKIRRDLARASARKIYVQRGSRESSASKRSPASTLSSRRRRAAWLEWRAERHALVPQDRVWLLDRLRLATFSGTGSFGRFVAGAGCGAQCLGRRQRDILPLPPIAKNEFKLSGMSSLRWSVFRMFVNVVIACLNWLFGIKKEALAERHHTEPQKAVICNIIDRTKSFLDRLQGVEQGSWERFVPDFVSWVKEPRGQKFQDLNAEKVDNLEVAAACDPVPRLPREAQEVVSDARRMFADAAKDLETFEAFSAGARAEYVDLVVRQLRCGKVGLSTWCSGGGTSFAVGKPDRSLARQTCVGGCAETAQA